MSRTWIQVFSAVTCFSVVAHAQAPRFVVAVDGKDANDGSLAAPFATVARAQEAVRQLLAVQPGHTEPIVVALRGGVYRLTESLRFGVADSGTETAPVIYAAMPGERPVLSGGEEISGWQVTSDGRWHVVLPDVNAGRWTFTELWVNGQLRLRPRLPKQGYYAVASTLDPTPAGKGQGFDRFVFHDRDLRADWANLHDVELLTAHVWSLSRLRIASVDETTRTVNLQGHTAGLSGNSQFTGRYIVENVREALSEPGEWYLDRPTGELTYIPLAGEAPTTTVVVAPRLQRLMQITGDLESGGYATHIEFRGLTFEHTNWVTPPEGQSSGQADANVPAAIEAILARFVAIDSCVIAHVGAWAVSFGRWTTHNRIENSELFDLGAGGVKIGTTRANLDLAEPKLVHLDSTVSSHVLRNTAIRAGGRVLPGAVAVWIGRVDQVNVEHNDISDFYYTGISVGWNWGYAPNPTHDNHIVSNRIYDLGQGVLSDLGGIYTLGVQDGTIISDNVVHDVDAFDYGGWGLYLDEGSSSILVTRNLVYNTKSGGFHQNYGRDNSIVNNIFAFGRQQQLQRSRVEAQHAFTFERNIVYWRSDAPLFSGDWQSRVVLRNNTYYCFEHPLRFPNGLTLQQRQQQLHVDDGSIVADPGFADATTFAFRVGQGSPAIRAGFAPFDFTKAGRTTQTPLTADVRPVPRTFP